MQTLAQTFFERDLSEDEEQRLEEELAQFGDSADVLAEEASLRYRRWGLPDPLSAGWARSASARRSDRWAWPLALAAGLVIGLVLPRFATGPSPKAGAVLHWTPAVALSTQGSSRLGFARQTAPATVDVRLELPNPELVVLKVVTSDGRVLRVLAAGRFEAGSHVFTWDRRDQAGHLVRSADWKVVADEGLALPAARP